MSDFTTIQSQYNSATDASPSWTSIAFGGSAGANEYRFCASGAGAGGTASASWPLYTRPGSTAAVVECWAFSADTTGVKLGTYTGTNANANVFRIDWDNLGTYAAAPSLSAYSDTTHAAASPGTQPGAQSGSPIINGHSTDTGSASYLKGNLFDTFQTSNLSAGTTGTVSVTSGTAGSVSPGAAAWLTNWQSLQAATQFITARTTPTATTAARAYFTLALYTGPNMSTASAMVFTCATWSYSYS